MGGDKNHHHNHHHMRSFHLLHLSHHGKKEAGGGLPPKGWMAIRVGAEQQRFVVPVGYLNHPLFARLLKEAEDEYGFNQKGAITIPCHVEHFRQVQGLIDRENGASSGQHHHHHHHHHNHHNHNHHYHLAGCFRA